MSALIQTFLTPTDLLLPSLHSHSPLTKPHSPRPFAFLRYNTQTKTKTLFRIFSQTQEAEKQTPKQPVAESEIEDDEDEEEDATWVPIGEYLIETLGFSEDEALLAAYRIKNRRLGRRENDIIFRENADNVITFFKENCGLDNSVIKVIVLKFPGVLAASVTRNLKPKINLLKDAGLTNSDLAKILILVPQTYLKTNLTPVVEFLKDYLGDNDRGIFAVCRNLRTSKNNELIKNVTMLENEYGAPRETLRKLLVKYPPKFIVSNDVFRDLLVQIEYKWGFSRNSADFVTAVVCLSGLNEVMINKKFQAFKEFGWQMSDIMSLYRGNIWVIRYKKDRVQEALNLYMVGFGFEPAQIARYPKLFSVNLEVVLVRHGLLLGLMEKGLIEADYDLASAFVLTEEEFVDKFVSPFVAVAADICEAYIKDRAPHEELFLEDTYEDEGVISGDSDAE